MIINFDDFDIEERKERKYTPLYGYTGSTDDIIGRKVILCDSSRYLRQNPRDADGNKIPGEIVDRYDGPMFDVKVRWGASDNLHYYAYSDICLVE